MIRVAIPCSELLARIDEAVSDWLTRAALLKTQNEQAGYHKDADKFWQKITHVLVRIQLGKCGYCERPLGSSGDDSTVDHFRPKGRVDAWQGTGELQDGGGSSRVGYYLLAYDPRNYVVACRRCNNRQKKSMFPTRRARQLTTTDEQALAEEQPYLVNPADPHEPDPEELIGWDGVIPVPAGITELERERALVTIDVLGLANEDLIRERHLVVFGVWVGHLQTTNGRPDPLAKQMLDRLCSSRSPHAACARRFRQLCDEDPDAAREVVDQVMRATSTPSHG
ncbi:hypothetical protein ACIOD2_49480 [Amycolatopsis sp. NPDC088138]|uniref:hypothetical protein n=1 Tax=Amycolatopsis sp. NPDC088138 TaxID=3363938 RepID=UPI00382122CD